MEEYERTDKTWWWATDFMYKHLLSTGQSWSHVQKLEFVTNLSEMFKRIQRNAHTPQRIRVNVTEATRLVDELAGAAQTSVWDGSTENNQKLIEARKNIIEAIVRYERELDEKEIRRMVLSLRDEAHRQGMRSRSNEYEDCVIKRQNELLSALGIE